MRKGACGRSLATIERRIETAARHPPLHYRSGGRRAAPRGPIRCVELTRSATTTRTMRTTAGMRKEEEKKDVRKGACGRSVATTERRIETVAQHPLLQLSQRWASCCVAWTDSVHRSNS